MRKEIKLTIGLLIFFLIFHFVFVVLPERKLNKYHRFTIASIYKIESQSEGSKEAQIIYSYKNQNYFGSFPLNSGKNYEINDRIFIKFQPENPNNAKVILEKKVPTSLKVNHYGWEKLPSYNK